MLDDVRQDRDVECAVLAWDPSAVEEGELHRYVVLALPRRVDRRLRDLVAVESPRPQRVLERRDDASLSAAQLGDVRDGSIDEELDATCLLPGADLPPHRLGIARVELGVVLVERCQVGAHTTGRRSSRSVEASNHYP